MKKLLLICIMAVAATMAKAQSTMVVQNSNDDSKKTGIKLDEVQKLTFANDKVVVSKNNGAADKTFDLNAVVESKKEWNGSKLSVAGLPEGMYLLSVEGVPYKFLKK